MLRSLKLGSLILVMALAAQPALAGDGKHGKHGKGEHHHHHDDHGKKHKKAKGYRHCPPGLAKKDIPCVPPGQAKKYYKHDHDHAHRDDDRRRYRVGDDIRLDDLIRIQNPLQYGLGQGQYYRDPYGIYQVDPTTRKIIAVLDLIKAFTQ